MKKNMITRFFFFFAHVTSIRNPPTPPELNQGQNSSLGWFPSKEANSLTGTRSFVLCHEGKASLPPLAKEEQKDLTYTIL